MMYIAKQQERPLFGFIGRKGKRSHVDSVYTLMQQHFIEQQQALTVTTTAVV